MGAGAEVVVVVVVDDVVVGVVVVEVVEARVVRIEDELDSRVVTILARVVVLAGAPVVTTAADAAAVATVVEGMEVIEAVEAVRSPEERLRESSRILSST